jgi:hypothetical protein
MSESVAPRTFKVMTASWSLVSPQWPSSTATTMSNTSNKSEHHKSILSLTTSLIFATAPIANNNNGYINNQPWTMDNLFAIV